MIGFYVVVTSTSAVIYSHLASHRAYTPIDKRFTQDMNFQGGRSLYMFCSQ
jgi:hypothetical protein